MASRANCLGGAWGTAVPGRAATARAADLTRHKRSVIDARSGRAGLAGVWGGAGGHQARRTGRGERAVPETRTLVPSQPAQQPRGVGWRTSEIKGTEIGQCPFVSRARDRRTGAARSTFEPQRRSPWESLGGGCCTEYAGRLCAGAGKSNWGESAAGTRCRGSNQAGDQGRVVPHTRGTRGRVAGGACKHALISRRSILHALCQ